MSLYKKDDSVAIIEHDECDINSTNDLSSNNVHPKSIKYSNVTDPNSNIEISTITTGDIYDVPRLSTGPTLPETGGEAGLEREKWSNKLDFLLSSLGYAVGLGNVWRFPYMCYRNGGGAFLIPYLIFLFLVGMPLFLIDVSLGQFTSTGPFTCWEYAPLFMGIGYAMVTISSLVSIYYNVIIAYSLYYFFASMSYPLPWNDCSNSWNTEACRSCHTSNQSNCADLYNQTGSGIQAVLPAQEYFNRHVLNISKDISEGGEIQWKIALCLLGSWIIVFLCLSRGIKSSGKVVYFTAIFPYVVLFILFIRGVLLSGSSEGIKFYIIPDISKLKEASVWKDAANQIFFSLSASWGGLITLASYNKFHNNLIRDTLIISISNSATSIFAGFVIFSYLGHLAGQLNTNVSNVAAKEMGLAFVIYPEAVKTMPGSIFWSLLFFFMLFLLGLDSQFAAIETVITGFVDTFPMFLRPRKTWFILLFCILFCLLGLPLTTTSGPYWLQLMDTYCGGWAILLIGAFEVISVGWIYGRPGPKWSRSMRLEKDIETMINKPISRWWRICWQWITPILMFAIIIYSWLDYQRAKYGDKSYPIWADFLGWLMTISSLFFIPGCIIYLVVKERRKNPYHTFKMIFRDLTTPTYKWGPYMPKHRLLAAKHLEDVDSYYIDVNKRIKYTDYLKLHNLDNNKNHH